MSNVNCEIRIGTSGWHYDHWSGRFYPPDLPKTKWFLHYAQHFDTVEVNNTFYQLPKPKSIENWRQQAPDNFLYTVKANRYITHIKRLKDSQEPLERFFEVARLLKEKLGPVLYQLPPSMHKDLDRLEAFIKLLPKKHPAVFEFRHESWFSEDTYVLLNRFNVGFCTHDLPGEPSPRIITGDLIYVRFHGTTGRYAGNYSKPALQTWAQWIKDNLKGTRAVYVYFNNDYNAYAVNNAKTLKAHLLIE
ncbi:MAG TPA: DUF72 domain-containing protein [Sedimentisphaerales bacterium]|nr:DUF72 domain-containing protein [Sedimentisphaerales bacterium]